MPILPFWHISAALTALPARPGYADPMLLAGQLIQIGCFRQSFSPSGEFSLVRPTTSSPILIGPAKLLLFSQFRSTPHSRGPFLGSLWTFFTHLKPL
jgi:hypothetical protein